MKSNVSDFLKLIAAVYEDSAIRCTADVSDLRDLRTIKSRVDHEGLSFLTITLPSFAKDLEQVLAKGFVDATLFSRWKRAKGAVMPAFLQGFTRQVVDFETGKVTYNEDSPITGGVSSDIPTIIDSVRQICCTFKKVELDCEPSRVAAAFDNFINVEQDFNSFQLPEGDTDVFLSVSSVLWHNMVADFSASNVIPRHGPGATAERISGNSKYVWQFWYDRLEPYFPFVDNGYPLGIPEAAKELQQTTIVPESEEQPVRVVAVPKTLKSPRIIAIEPCCMQYVQQGIRDYLYDKIESSWYTRGHINFTDQSVNQELAMKASSDGLLATIDLSDASDRVPHDLAMEMFRSNPDLRDSIEACRSTMAQLPDGRLVGPLKKFASMGSALCFPIEAMYFYTVCVIALLDCNGLSPTPANVFRVSRELYVYGDDILLPSTNAVFVLDYLRKYNCKVNASKTFYSGRFRESCGVDAFGGELVTPVYLRQVCPKDKRQATEIVSWVATANLFYKKGYWRTASFMRNSVELVVGPLPYVSDTSPGLGHFSYLGYCSANRWNDDFQCLEVRALVPEPVDRTDHLEGYGALMKFFVEASHSAEDDFAKTERSFEHSALRGAVTLKRRWIRAS